MRKVVLHTRADYIRCAKAGMTKTETAKHLKVKFHAVMSMARKHDIEFVKGAVGRRAVDDDEIDQAIIKALRSPCTLADLQNRAGFAENTIRKHLRALIKRGFVEMTGKVQNTFIWELTNRKSKKS